MRKILHSLLLLCTCFLCSLQLHAQKTVTGKILGENNEPLVGATIKVAGTNRFTLSGSDGGFQIQAKEGEMLQITHVGYALQQVRVGADNSIGITMVKTNESMSEVVVTAFGIKKEQKALGYSVTSLSSQELMKNKNTNVINSLAGKVPGVNVTQYSGAPGAGASITIRGGNSTSETRQNQPLFVIDGIIYDNSTTVTGNTGTDGLSRSNTTYSNRVMDVNPEDIESLSVLRGSAAAALYGSRAADGVVVITTKKGAEGNVRVNVTSKVGTSWANKLPEAQTEFGPGSYSSNGVLTTTNVYSSWGPKFRLIVRSMTTSVISFNTVLYMTTT